MENVLICQSCGMPMQEENLFGKEADGAKNEEYCTYCYQDGAFTAPHDTLESMINTCVPFMVEADPKLSPESARAQLEAFLPTLKRWQN